VSPAGQFHVQVQSPLTYRIVVKHPGYFTASQAVDVPRDHNTHCRVVAAPLLKNKAARIVLTWGKWPKKMVGMLRSPHCELDPDFPNRCDDPKLTVEHNDDLSHGPITIAINEWEPGNYFYSVTQVDPLDTVNFEDSDARVMFYDDKGAHEFKVATDGVVFGQTWHVFRIMNDGRLGTSRLLKLCRNEECRFGRDP